MTTKAGVYRYTGAPNWVPGMPARDMQADDYDRYLAALPEEFRPVAAALYTERKTPDKTVLPVDGLPDQPAPDSGPTPVLGLPSLGTPEPEPDTTEAAQDAPPEG